MESAEEDYEDPEDDPEGNSENENERNVTVTGNDNDMTQATPRRSQRPKKLPDRYNDYAFLTYKEIMNSKDKKKWIKAIQEEKNSLKENETWYEYQ